MANATRGVTARPVVYRFLIALVCATLAACGGGGSAGSSSDSPTASTLSVETLKAAAPASVPGMTAQTPSVVNTTTAGPQTVQALGALADGGYTVAWVSQAASSTSTVSSLFTQRYDAAGAKVGTEMPIPFDFGLITPATPPAVGVLSDGGVVVAYAAERQVSATDPFLLRSAIFTQRFDPAGAPVGGETQVASIVRQTLGARQLDFLADPVVLTWQDGTYLVGWNVRHELAALGVFLDFSTQLFDAGGVPVGAPVYFAGGGDPCAAFKLAALADGGYVAIAQCFMGNRLVSFQVNSPTHSGPIGTRFDLDGLPLLGTTLVPLTGGGYALWSTGTAGPYVQMLDSAGNPVGAPTPVASLPSLAVALSDGSYVALWPTSGSGLTAQRFDIAGAALGDPFQVDSAGATPLLAALSDGALAAAWTAALPGGDLDVMTQLFEPFDFTGKHAQQAIKRACQAEARTQRLTGQQRKAFMSACLSA